MNGNLKQKLWKYLRLIYYQYICFYVFKKSYLSFFHNMLFMILNVFTIIDD